MESEFEAVDAGIIEELKFSRNPRASATRTAKNGEQLDLSSSEFL